MRNIAILLSVLMLLVAGQARAEFMLNELMGFNAGGAANPSISFVACTHSTSALQNYTFTAASTGAAGATRRTLIGIAADDNATVHTISSVTVAGSAATELTDYGAVAGNTNVGFYIIDNPSGTTADIVVNLSEVMTGGSASICVWAVNDLTSSAPVATTTLASSNASAITLSANVSANGVAAGMCASTSTAQTTTWAGLTERADIDATVGMSYSGADYVNGATAQAPLAITCDYTGTSFAVGTVVSLR